MIEHDAKTGVRVFLRGCDDADDLFDTIYFVQTNMGG